MQGWVALHRQLISKSIWQNSSPEHKVILIALLLMANHQEKEWEWMGQKFKAESGQFVTSLESIREASGKGVSLQNVRSALKRFEKLGFLTNKSTKTGRLITIVKWAQYQDIKNDTNIPTNKEVTKSQQRGNKEVTPNNNDNNETMITSNKKIYAPAVSMTEEQHQKLLEKFGEQDTKDRIERLSLYKKSSGKRYKCDYSTILSWARKDEKEKPKGEPYGRDFSHLYNQDL